MILNITHGNCTDGTFSNIVVEQYCEINNIKMETFFAMYGQDEMPDVKGKDVIITDFSYDRETIEKMHDEANSLIVIDHHKTAEKELEGLAYAKFDMTHSGCVLTWKHLFPNDEVPEILLYVEDRDIWKWKLENSLEFSAGLKMVMADSMVDSGLLRDSYIVGEAKEYGGIILYHQDTVISNILKRISEKDYIQINGRKIICINNTDLISEVGNELATVTDEDMSLQYFFTNDKIIFSLRSIGDVDISTIAKEFGGGGHKNAAGFSIPLTEFCYNDLFVHKNLES